MIKLKPGNLSYIKTFYNHQNANHMGFLIYEPLKEVTLKVYWEDKTGECTKDFKTVQELAEFLREYPQLGKAVGYVPKAKR